MENGKEMYVADSAYKFGLMEQSMRVNGKMGKLMVEVK